MKRKFFITIFVFSLATILIVSVLQIWFFETERMRLIDQRLEAIASTLLASGLSLSLIENLDSTDDLIHDLLGEERVDQIINIYSLEGKVLAQNLTGSELELSYSPNEQWQTYEVQERTVRVFNLHSGNLVIQVGVVLNFTLQKMSVKTMRFVGFILIISALLLAIAYYTSGILFRPLKQLSSDLASMSSQLDRKLGQSLTGFVIGPQFSNLTFNKKGSLDEFERLCVELESFLKKLESYTKSFNAQMALLTHELKTPMTIVRNDLVDLQNIQDTRKRKQAYDHALAEIDHMAALVNNFLQWSVLVSNPETPDVYAIKLSEVVGQIIRDLNVVYHQRLHLKIENPNLKVFAHPDHVHQLVTNLLTNACKYSPQDQPVECRVSANSFCIVDHGHGIEKPVLDHLGSPFNRGKIRSGEAKSFGLGLAWVQTLCNRYGWTLKIQSTSQGTQIEVLLAEY